MKTIFLTSIILLSTILSGKTLTYDYIVMGTNSGQYIEKSEILKENGKCIFRLTTTSSIKIGRGDRSLNLETETISNSECKTFRPIDFYSKSAQGKSVTIQEGHTKNGKFIISIQNSNGKASKTIKLPKNILFFGNLFYKYKFKDSIPGRLSVLSEESLSISTVKTKSILSGKSKIVEMEYNSVPISTTLNNSGIPILTNIKEGLIVSILKGNKTVAKFKNRDSGDIISKSSILNKGVKIKRPRATSMVKIKISGLSKTEIIKLPYQQVSTLKNQQIVKSYTTALSKVKLTNREKFLKTNIYENSDYPPIKNQSLRWRKLSPEKIVEKAVRFVYKHISNKNYANGQLTAAEAFDKKEGDCTEHAALLAALLKAAGVPVRMVYGVILMPDNKFYYHNWNDVFINGNWQPVDSTFNTERADAARVALFIGENSSFDREKIGTLILQFVGSVELSVKESK